MSRSIEALLARVKHPSLKQMVTLWNEKRAGRVCPTRGDFDPFEFRFAMGHVSLIDVHDAPTRFFFRLDGTKQVELFGIDCTRKFLDQAVAPESARAAEESFGAAVETGEPQHRLRQLAFHDRFLDYEIIVLPLSSDGNRIDMLMTVTMPAA